MMAFLLGLGTRLEGLNSDVANPADLHTDVFVEKYGEALPDLTWTGRRWYGCCIRFGVLRIANIWRALSKPLPTIQMHIGTTGKVSLAAVLRPKRAGSASLLGGSTTLHNVHKAG